MRTTCDFAVSKIKQWEGLRLNSYQDSGGVWTIGYGHTSDTTFRVGPGQTITEEKATELLRQDLREAEETVDRAVKVTLNDNQFGALVSFTLNVGVDAFKKSTLLKKLNAGDYAAVPSELRRWNKDNGVVVEGLVNRRAAEIALWNKGAFVSSASVAASPTPSVTASLAKPEVVMAALGASGTVATAASGDGPLAWAISSALVLAVGFAIYYFIRKERRK